MVNVDFGPKHLTGLAWLACLIVALLIILVTIKKKYKPGDAFDRAVIRYTCYFMWAWEIVKTVRMINYTDLNFGPVGHYPVWMAPFHICSMGLYMYLIIGSKRHGKLADWVTPFPHPRAFSARRRIGNSALITFFRISPGSITVRFCSFRCIWRSRASIAPSGSIS